MQCTIIVFYHLFFFNDTATTEIYTYLTHSFPTRRSSDLPTVVEVDCIGIDLRVLPVIRIPSIDVKGLPVPGSFRTWPSLAFLHLGIRRQRELSHPLFPLVLTGGKPPHPHFASECALVDPRLRREGLNVVGQRLLRHRTVVDTNGAFFIAPGERMLHPVLVVAVGEILARVRAARFLAVHGRFDRDHCLIDQVEI